MKLKAKWMGLALTGAALSGCGAILGLDEFTEGAGGTSTSTSTGTSSVSTGGGECTGVETQSCYEFDAATLDKGVCKGGTKTCKDGVFGACEGQVGPSAEDCSKPEDESCDGVACSEAIWSEEFGDTAISEDLATAPDGSILVAGVFGDSINFGPTPMTALTVAKDHAAYFLAKLAPDGSHLWSKALVQTGDSNVFSRVATGLDGQIFMSGAYEGAIDIDGQMLSVDANNQLSFFVASFDKGGKRLWAKSFGATSKAILNDLAVGPDGDLVIVGEYKDGDIVFDGVTYSSPVGKNAFVAKLAHGGGAVGWSNSYGADMSDEAAMAVAVASSGEIAVAGSTNATISFGGGGDLPLGGGLDVFVAQLGSTGDHLWHAYFRGPNDEMVSSVAVDSLGGVYVAGSFSGVTQFDALDLPTSKTTTGAMDTDFYLAKLNASGTHGWIKQLGDGKPQVPQSPFYALPALPRVSVDSKGDVLIAGGFLGSIQLGTAPLTSAGDSDWFLGKLTSGGDPLWSKSFGDSAPSQIIASVGSDFTTGAVVVTGVNDGSLAVGPGAALKATGSLSMVVAKLNP